MTQSIINKTPISNATNRFISAKAPSRYVSVLAEKAQVSLGETRTAIESHNIEPSFLESDDFHGFFQDRRLRLLALIGDAMGKPVLGGEFWEDEEFEVWPNVDETTV